MSHLVRKDNPDVRIVGTYERLYGVANISEASMVDGRIAISYGGGTDVHWDSQQTVPDGVSGRMFIDENGDGVTEANVCIAAPEVDAS